MRKCPVCQKLVDTTPDGERLVRHPWPGRGWSADPCGGSGLHTVDAAAITIELAAAKFEQAEKVAS